VIASKVLDKPLLQVVMLSKFDFFKCDSVVHYCHNFFMVLDFVLCIFCFIFIFY